MAALETDLILKSNPGLIDSCIKMVEPGHLGLVALAGSRSYGLAHEKSDLDLRGFFVAPTENVLGLHALKEQNISAEPDAVFYEIGKFAQLALNANPVALEVLFAERPLYSNSAGDEIIEARDLFLSQNARARYVGYAKSQLAQVEKQLDGAASVDRFKEATRSKHLRHIFRLLDQGYELLSSGHLSVRVADPESIRARAALPLEEIRILMDEAILRIDQVPSPLPLYPDKDAVSDIVVGIRKRHLQNP